MSFRLASAVPMVNDKKNKVWQSLQSFILLYSINQWFDHIWNTQIQCGVHVNKVILSLRRSWDNLSSTKLGLTEALASPQPSATSEFWSNALPCESCSPVCTFPLVSISGFVNPQLKSGLVASINFVELRCILQHLWDDILPVLQRYFSDT